MTANENNLAGSATRPKLPVQAAEDRKHRQCTPELQEQLSPRTRTNKRIAQRSQAFAPGSEREEWIDWNLRLSPNFLIEDVTQRVANCGSKKRFHRRKYFRVVSLILANLIKCEGTWLRYPRGRDGYRPPEVPTGIGCDAIVNTMDCLIHHGLIDGKLGYFDRGRHEGAASLARATPTLSRLVAIKQAGDVVNENWSAIYVVANQLLIKQSLSYEQVKVIVDDTPVKTFTKRNSQLERSLEFKIGLNWESYSMKAHEENPNLAKMISDATRPLRELCPESCRNLSEWNPRETD